MDQVPLSELYASGAKTSLEIASSSGRPNEDSIKVAIRALQICEQRIEGLGLFSMNEDAEDIATGDLRYLLVTFHLGLLLASIQDKDPEIRSSWLKQSRDAYSRFLRLCKAYQLIPRSALTEDVQDAQTKRAMKIQRYKDLKSFKDMLATLQQKSVRQRHIQKLEEEDGVNISGIDEDLERDLWLKQIQIASVQAVDQQLQISQELEILAHASSLPQSEREKPLPAPPEDVLKKLQLAASNLGTQRQQIAKDVFRPSHRLPTRTLKEQAEIESAQARVTAEKQAKAEKQRKELEADEDYSLAKQRAWDDWKDDHQRGEGNSKLRPTA